MTIRDEFIVTNLIKKISRKTGEEYVLIKLLDNEGDTTEMFCSADIPADIEKMDKVQAEVRIKQVGDRTYITCTDLRL